TEDLERFHLPAQFLRDKIYLWDYPKNSLQERPTVNEALVRTLNEGSLILNYVGHGNPSLFAHERVFTNQSDLPRLRNGVRLPVVFTASCSIGFFDDPYTEGMSERLVRMEGGAILVVSATRLVYSQANALFNRVAYDHIFGPQNLTVAQAVFAAKMTRADAQGTKGNDRRYAIFGDPWLRLGAPAYEVEYTSAPDTLVALTPTVIAGRVVDEFGAPVSGFTGTAQVVVYDTRATRNHKVLNSQGDVRADVSYDVNGAALYRGSAAVVNGQFSVTFVPSLDVGFGGAAARISVYASDNFSDAIGVIDSLPISATVPSTTDYTGPEISLVLPERSGFVSGDPIGPSEEIIVRLADTSGINLGAGFGHGITLMIDNEITSELTLSESFVYVPGSFRSGSASVALPNLAPGTHTFRVKAWDNANNSASLTFTAHVTLQTALSIDQLLNYPNPMQEMTAFYFTLMAPVTRMSLEIFTVSGIKVHEAEERDLPQGYNEGRFAWDGRDQDGDRVATGVYVYRAVAHPADPGEPVEEFGKLIVVN
ncbi:MAG TPA: C25 family cysteine peptidase, partial [candidate division Zixibacteria bacterium]|nr:C25 family cysteine peptidase [candidate division Zixibacteria bacterium]